MGRLRLPDRSSAGRRNAPLLPTPPVEASPVTSPRDVLLRSRAGRLFLVSAVVKLVLALLERAVTLPAVLSIVGIAATLGLLASVGYFIVRLIALTQRQLLWRVRRRLILSYIFIGVLPAMLIIGFALLAAATISMNVSAYLFRDGYDSMLESVGIIAQAAASDVARDPSSVKDILARTHRVSRERFRNLSVSVAFIPAPDSKLVPIRSGSWDHGPPPERVPAWAAGEGFVGTTAVPMEEGSGEVRLVLRGLKHARGTETRSSTDARPAPLARVGTVVVDLVMDDVALDYLHERTGVKGGAAWLPTDENKEGALLNSPNGEVGISLFRNSVTFLDCTAWGEGTVQRAAIAISYSLGNLWSRISASQAVSVVGYRGSIGALFLLVLWVVGFLFLIIQGVALVMGLALARSITSAIHELFMGTERVRQGDFAHRIQVTTNDQLGELAQSFNQMTGSIEGLLLTAAEKKRLDEELRIARQIQMSLLPRGPLDIPGLGVTALCVPAREVGGDYYDFFNLPDDRLGVLIADVAGKGTSAALYMAELKGLVLALSQTHHSPRDLLIEVNRIISENLDSRTFITMTYCVIDRRAGVMAYCRAGHTPMIHLTGVGPDGGGAAQVLTPSGMVVGLRIPGAADKFDELLEEHRIPLRIGDVIVLYTDGITEAMNPANDLFGEARLGRIVEEHGHLASGELRERILREIEAFVAGADQHDDMTMILLKVEQSLAP
jgi:sigma-B regulation protein RsbU (phosphoserine phosphatase)